MKYRILPFILVILLASCTGKHGNDGQSATVTDSIPQKNKTGGLFDSIHDTRLKKIVSDDGIELLSVKHVIFAGYPDEQILFLDHDADRNTKDVFDDFNMNVAAMIPDSLTILPNPLTEMKGKYKEIFNYKGKYMTAYTGEITYSDEIVIADSAMIWIPDGMSFMVYKKGERAGDKVTYFVSETSGKIDTIEIKLLNGELKMQLWKWPDHGHGGYSLRVPADKIGSLPYIVAANNIGLDGNMEVIFDKINYDSLWQTK